MGTTCIYCNNIISIACETDGRTFGNLEKYAFHFHIKPWLYFTRVIKAIYVEYNKGSIYLYYIKLIDIFPGKIIIIARTMGFFIFYLFIFSYGKLFLMNIHNKMWLLIGPTMTSQIFFFSTLCLIIITRCCQFTGV